MGFNLATNQVGYLEGTAFPSWEGNTVLTAHITLADGLPGPFANLDKMQYGEQIILHAWGKCYIYEVRTNENIRPNDFRPLKHEDYAWLTLITCDEYNEKLETYIKRTVVRALLVKIEENESSP